MSDSFLSYMGAWTIGVVLATALLALYVRWRNR
jgi:hypothetical protein